MVATQLVRCEVAVGVHVSLCINACLSWTETANNRANGFAFIVLAKKLPHCCLLQLLSVIMWSARTTTLQSAPRSTIITFKFSLKTLSTFCAVVQLSWRLFSPPCQSHICVHKRMEEQLRQVVEAQEFMRQTQRTINSLVDTCRRLVEEFSAGMSGVCSC